MTEQELEQAELRSREELVKELQIAIKEGNVGYIIEYSDAAVNAFKYSRNINDFLEMINILDEANQLLKEVRK